MNRLDASFVEVNSSSYNQALFQALTDRNPLDRRNFQVQDLPTDQIMGQNNPLIPIEKLKGRFKNLTPFRTLDVPGLVHDFFSHLVTHNQTNMFCALGKKIYNYNFTNKSVDLLLDCTDIPSCLEIAQNHLAVGYNSGLIEIHDQQKVVLPTKITTLFYEDHLLFAGESSGKLTTFDLRDLRNRTSIQCNSGAVCSMDKTGFRYATGGQDGNVKIWDLRKNENLRSLPHPASVRALSFHPQNSTLATGSDKIRIWDELGLLKGSYNTYSQIYNLFWNGNNHFFTTNQNKINIWHSNSSAEITPIRSLELNGEVIQASYNAGKLITADSAENLNLWQVNEPVKDEERPSSLLKNIR